MMKMILTRRCACLLALLLSGLALPGTASAQQQLNLNATLILGTNQGDNIDPALRNLVPMLRRVLPPFSSYTRLGGGSARLQVPGNTTMNLGGGYTLRINGAPAGDGVRASFQLQRGGKTLINANRPFRPGSGTIIGGFNHGNGKIVLYIQAR